MEINSFNELFACAKEHGAYLDSFYQDADGQFAASWRAGPRIPGERRCPHAKRVHPFNAARDALLTLIETAPARPKRTCSDETRNSGKPVRRRRQRNLRYARAALRDSLLRGEAPIASHLLYTQDGVLDDALPDERRRGIDAGHAWLEKADLVVVYSDLGISSGMKQGVERAAARGVPVVYRTIGWPK